MNNKLTVKELKDMLTQYDDDDCVIVWKGGFNGYYEYNDYPSSNLGFMSVDDEVCEKDKLIRERGETYNCYKDEFLDYYNAKESHCRKDLDINEEYEKVKDIAKKTLFLKLY